MKRPLIALDCAVATGIGGIVAANQVFYYQGRAGIPLALLLFWGGVLILVVAPLWLLIHAMRRK
jgi:hypothetical protein